MLFAIWRSREHERKRRAALLARSAEPERPLALTATKRPATGKACPRGRTCPGVSPASPGSTSNQEWTDPCFEISSRVVVRGPVARGRGGARATVAGKGRWHRARNDWYGVQIDEENVSAEQSQGQAPAWFPGKNANPGWAGSDPCPKSSRACPTLGLTDLVHPGPPCSNPTKKRLR